MATAKTTKTKKTTKKSAKPTVAGSQDRRKIADLVFAGMRSGMSAFKACQAAGVPQSTFSRWMDDDAKLAEEYARAREDLIEHIASETLAIADQPVGSTENGSTDSGAVQKQRLQVDTRKWLLSKLAPKKYGEKTSMELTGANGGPVQISDTERAAKIAAILATAQARKDGDVTDLV